jgi:phospho-N-acetylmuramoyl-pentapeptide-transferase
LSSAFLFFLVTLTGSSNAINLTDGLDGLAIGCTVTVALTYAIMAYASGNFLISDYLKVSWIPGSGELTVVCSALLGGSLAFLWFNAHPAEVFMGDTGSLAIGGLVGIIAFNDSPTVDLDNCGRYFCDGGRLSHLAGRLV